MSRIGSKNTEPEKHARKVLTSKAIRYRLHRRDLPGRPDIYIPRLHIAIFVNGCFWHGHDCRRGRRPKTNTDFWNAKINRNIERDAEVNRLLAELGIECHTVWSCSLAEFESLASTIATRYKQMA